MVTKALQGMRRTAGHALYAIEGWLDALLDAQLPYQWREPERDYECRGNPHTANCPPESRKP